MLPYYCFLYGRINFFYKKISLFLEKKVWYKKIFLYDIMGSKECKKKIERIALIGMRGCGKSHFASCIAQELGWAKIDTDDEIVRISGKSVARVVKEGGWDEFRDWEHGICKKVSSLKNVVISSGGGAITFERNREFLTHNTLVIFLFTPFSVLMRRTQKDESRPSLTQKESWSQEIIDVWNERKDIYFDTADIVFRAQEIRHLSTQRNVEWNVKILVEKIKEFL